YVRTKWRMPAGLLVPAEAMEKLTGAHNQRYLYRWTKLLTHSSFKGYYPYIARKYEPRFTPYGYSLTKGMGKSEEALCGGSKTYTVVGPLCCLGADAFFFCWRFGLKLRWHTKQRIKALLPQFVLTRLRQARARSVRLGPKAA